jgi:beta-glucosidase
MSTFATTPGPAPDTERAPSPVLTFPPDFLWGAATAAYQVEGAATEDGRGPSIWDTFCRVPGKVRGGDTGDVATDHYHHWKDDVALMRGIGLRSYRFSIAWPRIQPEGKGPASERGLDFYRRLIDALLAADIVPMVTIYHWDLPQALQDAGGWPARDTAYRFADYALRVYEALGDRVPYWITMNEPWCSAFLGYGIGVHAPGITDYQQWVSSAHHLLLGHGLAIRAMRAAGSGTRMLGIVVNPVPVTAASNDPADLDAARQADGMRNRLFLDPIFRGAYPEDVLEDMAKRADLSYIQSGDLETIAAPIDVLGVNYYHRDGIGPPGPKPPKTAMGWEVDPAGLLDLLTQIHRTYGPIPMMITENGAAYEDHIDPAGRVRDPDRISFIDQHLRMVWQAIQAGIDVRGYIVWSLMDNFEWSEGYARRFGLVYVDYANQQRILKDSASWYRRVIADNGVSDDGLGPDAG